MGNFGIDDELVRRLAKLLEETGLNEIEYERDGESYTAEVPLGEVSS